MNKYLFVAAITLISTQHTQYSYAQGYNTRPGYIVKITNDTVYGSFKDRSDLKTSISFKQKEQSNFTEYTPEKLKGFSFDNSSFYKSCDVPVDSIRSQRIFMQVLVDGYMSLYYAENAFYMIERGSEKYILEKKEDKIRRVDDTINSAVRTIAIEDKRYLGQMMTLVSDCPKLNNKLNNIAFAPSDLSKTVIRYNNCKEPEKETASGRKTSQLSFTYGFKLDYLLNDMDNYIEGGRYHNENFATKPCLSGGLVFAVNLNRKFSVQTEVLLTQRKSSVYSENVNWEPPEDIKWDMVYLELPLSFYYTFPTRLISPHIFAGGLIGSKVLDKSEIHTIYSTVATMQNMEMGYRAGAGLTCSLSGKSKLRLEYYYELTHTNINYIKLTYHQIANNFSASVLF